MFVCALLKLFNAFGFDDAHQPLLAPVLQHVAFGHADGETQEEKET
jgi:hypothetical protein